MITIIMHFIYKALFKDTLQKRKDIRVKFAVKKLKYIPTNTLKQIRVRENREVSINCS